MQLCAAGTLRLAKSRRKAAVARMHARCGSRGGGLTPSCESPPPEEGRGCPRPQTNFIHMLWKNLICDHAALLLPAFEIQIPLQNERRRDRVHGLAVFFLLFARLVQDLMRGDRGAALVP